jgi:release factor glutamine methyltransferase
VGQKTFCGLELLTAPGRVMIPRPASERLVDASLDLIRDGRTRVVDVGTGSGAVAIAIAAAAPEAIVWATDTSREAVALARANVRRHNVADRVIACQGDLLEPVPGPVDLVVANLPYLPAETAARRPDLACEPHAALFSDGDGLAPYRRLLGACACRLGANGAVAIQLHRRVLTATRDELPRLLGAAEALHRTAARSSESQALAAAA